MAVENLATRVLLVLVALLIGVVAGLVACLLASRAGGSLKSALTSGAVSFGGAVTLTLAIENALGLL